MFEKLSLNNLHIRTTTQPDTSVQGRASSRGLSSGPKQTKVETVTDKITEILSGNADQIETPRLSISETEAFI